jgi:hypothetical protein
MIGTMAIEVGDRVYHRRADLFGTVVDRAPEGGSEGRSWWVRYDPDHYEGPDVLVPESALAPEFHAFHNHDARLLTLADWDAAGRALQEAVSREGPALQTRPANAPGEGPGAPGAMLEAQEEFDRLVEFWLAAYGEVRRFLTNPRIRQGVSERTVAKWEGPVGGEAMTLVPLPLAPSAEEEAFVLDAGRDARGALILHDLPEGGAAARCGLMGPPKIWPPGNFYERDFRMVNCPDCRAAVDPVGRGG